MGARKDFVKALLIGVIVGVAITTVFFQLWGRAECPSGPAGAGNVSKPHDR